ncbi:DUF5753 domain-containing protein [Streptomyces sp. NPDC093225]|uniref:DUF5753 domain-containing protein n=1 Tax=Streptomyces sp. NPDC093225 TaxID=3366034 RepID=UPI0038264C80
MRHAAGDGARLDRQSILRREVPPWMWFILDEAVLYRPVGGRLVMREQLEHLLDLGRLPRVRIQVLPFSSAEPATIGSSFTVLSLPDGREVAYEEGVTFGRLFEDTGEVLRRTVVYDRLQADALSPVASARLVRAAIEERYPCT